MNTLVEQIETLFLNKFPASYIRSSVGCLGSGMYITLALGQREQWSNGYIQNDPLYHIISVYPVNDGFEIKTQVSGLMVNPREQFVAMSRVKTAMRKKTGTLEQVLKHAAKWVDNLKTTVDANRQDIYGGADKYQNF